MITKTADGSPAYSGTLGHQISDDGRTVVFGSDSSVQLAGDTNGVNDVFMAKLTDDTSVEPQLVIPVIAG